MKLIFIILSAIILTSTSASANLVIEPNIDKLTQQFRKTMMTCPDKIWADYDWSDLTVLFYQKNKDSSLVWNATDDSFTEISNLLVPLEAQYGDFSFFEYQEKPTLSLSSQAGDFSESYMFQLAVHEMFHYQGQKKWINKSTNGRHTEYPLDSRPRFLRRMIFDNLKKYFLTKNSETLAKASYWYLEWKTNYPKELLSTTDGYEGSAQYVDTMALAIDTNSCNSTDSKLKSFLDTYIQSDFGASVSAFEFALDSEGYDIGGLASLILRFNNYNLKTLSDEHSNGVTSLEILLEDVQPLSEDAPVDILELFTSKVSELNQKWGRYIDKDISNWSNIEYVRVSTPFSMVNGSFSPMFFAYSLEISAPMFPFALDQNFISSQPNKSNFIAKAPTVLIENYSNPCATGPVTLVHKDDLELSHNNDLQEIDLDTSTLTGHLVGKEIIDSEGITYFCVQ